MGQYQVPQDVQREDKVFGPFSLRQFLYLIAGAAVGYMAFTIISALTSTFVGLFVGLLLLAGFGAFAFVEIQGKELPDFMVALIIYLLKPSKRVWKKDFSIPDVAYIPKKKPEKKEKEQTAAKTNLEQLAHILDTRGWAELAKREEKKEIETVHEKFSEAPKEKTKTPPPPPPASSKTEQKTQTKKKIVKQEEEIKTPPAPPIAKKVPEAPSSTAPTPGIAKQETAVKKTPQIVYNQKKEKEIEAALAKVEEKAQAALRKKIKKEVKEELKEKKQEIKKFKKSISKIEKKIPKKVKKIKIKKTKKPKQEFDFKKAYAQAYTFNLGGRITTPRIKEESTNIKVDESLLDDMLEETEEIKSIKKELAEVGKAIKSKSKTKRKPRIVKEGEAFYQQN